MTTKTTAVLLAAGASRRMGSPKPLLLWRGQPLVRHMAETLLAGGAAQVIVVVAPTEAGRHIAACVEDLPDVVCAENADWERGMLTSVQAGLHRAARAGANGGLLICPCDMPQLEPAHVAGVLKEWMDGGMSPDVIVAPTWENKRGHPTLFGAAFWETIAALDAQTFGLNEVLKRFAPCVVETPITTQNGGAILQDADTPEEWQHLQNTALGK